MADLINKRALRATIRKLEVHKAAIAKHRDAIKDILDDMDATMDSTQEGYNLLSAAIDELSACL